MDTIKNTLILASALSLPHSRGHMTLNTDACNGQIRYNLLEKQTDGTIKSIIYWSRLLTDTERRYDTMQRECVAIVWSILRHRPYVKGKCFLIRIGHDELKWILNHVD